jgi:hypothetical protein
MVDPSNALQSFQRELLRGRIGLQPGQLDPGLFLHVDTALGERRLTYVRLEGQTVTALVMFVVSEPIDRTTCFGIGYAVPEGYRNQGRAKEIIEAAIADLRHGLGRQGPFEFYVEAIIGASNLASQRVAEQVISKKPIAVTDQQSGLPAFQYLRKVEPLKRRRGKAPKVRSNG